MPVVVLVVARDPQTSCATTLRALQARCVAASRQPSPTRRLRAMVTQPHPERPPRHAHPVPPLATAPATTTARTRATMVAPPLAVPVLVRARTRDRVHVRAQALTVDPPRDTTPPGLATVATTAVVATLDDIDLSPRRQAIAPSPPPSSPFKEPTAP